MRWLLSCLLFLTSWGGLPLAAQDTSPAAPAAADTVVQEYSGSGTTTTGLFKVADRWEVRWNARQVVSVAVMSADGTIVAGAAGVLRGSLFVPLGGQYYFKVSDGTVAPPPETAPTPPTAPSPPPATNTTSTNAPPSPDTNAPAASTNAPPAASSNAAPLAITNAPPPAPTPPAPTDTSAEPPPEPAAVAWHLQVVQLATSVSSNQALTVYTPFFMLPDSAVVPAPTPTEPPPPVLTTEQAQSVVSIKGDNAQGTGFLMRSADGTFVVTHLSLLAANPNVKILTNAGVEIVPLSLKGATDRDLAYFAIKDDSYHYLPFSADAASHCEAGDQLIIPEVAVQSEILLGKPGRIIGLTPDRVDFDNPIGFGNDGSPVIHVPTGNVLGLVTYEKRVDVSDFLAKTWTANPVPGAAGIFPFYGLRLAGVAAWETYDPARFLAESLLLTKFHHDTRCLDSFLNGLRRRPFRKDSGAPDNQYYLTNAALHTAMDNYHQFANGADRSQRFDAARELLSDVQSMADTDVETLKSMHMLYAYDQTRAKEEMTYRKALRRELDDLGDNIVHLDNLARSH